VNIIGYCSIGQYGTRSDAVFNRKYSDSTVPYQTEQNYAVQYGIIQYSTVLHGTEQYSA
jgi:hypothetical protein